MTDMKLLLVDDETRFLETTQKVLSRKGLTVDVAGSGREALSLLAGRPIHVVILDVKMPEMDGVATLKEIKRLWPMIEVIMLTGNATVESAIEGLKAGAFDYLMKPCDIDDLIGKAREAYEKMQLHEQKIRMAQSRTYMKSPREILKQTDET
ncbi:MAG: response regulator [Proteobacteria bacterium]|nr:response regulator [Pseudomonadota bacterium]